MKTPMKRFDRALHRLEHQKHISKQIGKPFFTSDLSTNEYLLARQAGVEPIGLVMGSSFYHVGFFQNFWGYRKHTGEVEVLTQAQLTARELAIARLQHEAAILGAHGVIGVRLKRSRGGWMPGLLEFTAIGTAIRIPGQPPTEEPFTSDLSGQDFWKLRQAGYMPKGLVFGVCSYYIHSDRTTRQITNQSAWNRWYGQGRRNQEMVQYTQGFQDARELAVIRMTEDLKHLDAQGAVGMTIEAKEEAITYQINPLLGCLVFLLWVAGFLTSIMYSAHISSAVPMFLFMAVVIVQSLVNSFLGRTSIRRDLLIHFIAIGTAIKPGVPPPQNPIGKTLLITPLNSL